MAIKKTLTGWDFCKCPPCEERGNEIYPTTSDDQVIIDGLGSTLAAWLNIGRDGTYYTSLYSWLQANYPNSSYTLPVATDSILGGVIVDTTNLTISNDGVLSVDVNSLNIPSVGTATFSASGTMKLGNSTTLTSNFSDGTISGQVHDAYSYSGHVYALPLRLDAQGRAGVVVPTDLFAVNQSKAASTWTFDWSKKVTNVSIGTPTSGVETNYILLGNKDVNTANGELGYDDDGELSTSCGYPRLALVAGDGITMTRYTNTFIPQADNYWGGNITEILISADSSTYTGGEGISINNSTINQSIATNDSLGGIKLGYVKEGNKKPVEINSTPGENYGKAYVDTEQHPTVGGMITSGLSAHFFRVGTATSAGSFTADKWIPIIVSHSDNIGKCSVEFEIFGREDGKTSYGKYYVNHMTDKTNMLLCLSFYSEDTNHLAYDDVRVAKYAVDSDNVTLIVYKKVRNVTDSMFIVNILAENSSSYSTQHYFHTGTSSIAEPDYLLTNDDLRIGTYNSSSFTMTARLENDSETEVREMATIGAINGTFYSS